MSQFSKISFFFLVFHFTASCLAQKKNTVNIPEDKTYHNPIIHADYSDPDVIRVGDDFYMTASSFNAIPGLPILHSKDLVNWQIIGYALQKLQPSKRFDYPQHGNGVWAPSLRYHNKEFYIYYPDPDEGIFLSKAKNINGPWTEPILVEAGKGLIDPCPLWDEDGKNYLVHAYAGSRAGFKSIIVLKQLNATADKVISDAVLLYDGHDIDPTIEGPKIYKRNHYYYIFAPAGGVETGWQLALRSKKITGPYERKVVMAQGSSSTNGPHQGAWVQLKNGEDWFIHFQDKGAYGRIVHLQPMRWENDWPVIGTDEDGDGIGEPVLQFKKPAVGKNYPEMAIQSNDEFAGDKIGLQWQWHANPSPAWAFGHPAKNLLRLNAVLQNDSIKNLWDVSNLLLQKLPAEKFSATVKFSFNPKTEGERFGMVIMGTSYAFLSLVKKADSITLTYNTCQHADKGNKETETVLAIVKGKNFYFNITVNSGAICTFKYSEDGKTFREVQDKFIAKPGKWIGAKIGFFCNRINKTNDAGFAELDWLRFVQ